MTSKVVLDCDEPAIVLLLEVEVPVWLFSKPEILDLEDTELKDVL